MIDITKNDWSRLGEAVKGTFRTLLGLPSNNTYPRRECLARRYAECDDFAHCRYCSTVEQALRTANWVERNWPHVQARKHS
jgi:hypothetical protein